MSFDANHIGFVLGSYAISALVIAGLIVMHIMRARRHDRRLGELESQGAPRRKPRETATK
ncbi:MAG: heme exporter protein CcmD [Rhizobiales bacterium]|nr:heme exporter protein CcmD [Hyphomicrobiales bacterium]